MKETSPQPAEKKLNRIEQSFGTPDIKSFAFGMFSPSFRAQNIPSKDGRLKTEEDKDDSRRKREKRQKEKRRKKREEGVRRTTPTFNTEAYDKAMAEFKETWGEG